MSEEQPRGAKTGGGRSFLVTLVIVALVGALLWLLAERNAHQWFLVYEDGVLQVKKGVMFPVGRQSFRTDDPALAQAYAPLKPPSGAKLDEERGFDDRAGLDQALFELLARWAREDIATGRAEMIERALGWLSRADRLAGVSATQREDLRALRAESGYFEARQLLEKSADTLRQARERLRLTAASSSSHASDAGEALRRLEPAVDELDRVARLLAPTTASRPPEPEPASATPAPPATTPAAPAAAGQDGGTR
jgi:hypothetical protein